MERRQRRRAREGASKWIRFYEEWLPILVGLASIVLIAGFAVKTWEWKRLNKPPEATHSYVVKNFEDLIYPPSTKLERWMFEPGLRYWRFQYRPEHRDRFTGDLGRLLLAKSYLVRSNRANELRVELDQRGPLKRVSIIQLSRTDGLVTIHIAEIPDRQNTADYWTRVSASLSHRSQERQ